VLDGTARIGAPANPANPANTANTANTASGGEHERNAGV
jgi:hypothetical protein